jgi:hypothetical protein
MLKAEVRDVSWVLKQNPEGDMAGSPVCKLRMSEIEMSSWKQLLENYCLQKVIAPRDPERDGVTIHYVTLCGKVNSEARKL